MADVHKLKLRISDRNLSVIVFSLFFAWLLALPFEGDILYGLFTEAGLSAGPTILAAMAMHLVGLALSGFFIKSIRSAKNLMLGSILFCILATGVFLSPPSFLWTAAILSSSLLAGSCVAAWGFFLKSATPTNERIKTIADALIGSNVTMIILNVFATNSSPYVGLLLSIAILMLAFLFALRLPSEKADSISSQPEGTGSRLSIVTPLAFLCVFIVVITINSGLMYQVQGPAFAHLAGLRSWYWAIPYIVALYIMRNLPRKTNRAYILHVAIAMIGFSFIAFMVMDRSASSFLVVNTLMLGACGVYDLFWWSVLGEMLDLHNNPATILGIGLSANVLGILLGGLIGSTILSSGFESPNSTLLALSVVCVTLVILPPLHRRLALVLKDHAYLTVLSDMSLDDQGSAFEQLIDLGQLTERESEIADLLLKGRTYRMIAAELYITENTVKTHIKNIYAKFAIRSRAELMNIMLTQEVTLRP